MRRLYGSSKPLNHLRLLRIDPVLILPEREHCSIINTQDATNSPNPLSEHSKVISLSRVVHLAVRRQLFPTSYTPGQYTIVLFITAASASPLQNRQAAAKMSGPHSKFLYTPTLEGLQLPVQRFTWTPYILYGLFKSTSLPLSPHQRHAELFSS